MPPDEHKSFAWSIAPDGQTMQLGDRLAEVLGVPRDLPIEFEVFAPLVHPFDHRRLAAFLKGLRAEPNGSQFCEAHLKLVGGKYLRTFSLILDREEGSGRTLILDAEVDGARVPPPVDLSQLLEAVPVAVSIVDAAGLVVATNSVCTRLTGIHLKEHIGRHIDDPSGFVTDADGKRLTQDEFPITRILAGTEKVVDQRIGVMSTAGHPRWLRVHAVPSGGELDGAIAFFADETLEHQFGERRSGNQNLIFNLIEATPAAVFVTDADGRYALVNQAYTELVAGHGGTPGGIIGKTAEEFLPPDIARVALETDRQAIETNETVAVPTAMRVGGEVRDFQIWKRALRDDLGVLRGTCGVVLDITPERRALAELTVARDAAEAATRAKAAFLANMSHEIRTPLNAIVGLNYLALKGEMPSRTRAYLLKIHKETEHLLEIVNDVLDFSKIEAGKLTVERVPFSLTRLLDDLKTIEAVTADEKGLKLSIEVGPNVPDVLLGDSFRLRQILSNLVSNALKFTDQGGVTVRVTSRDLFRGPQGSEDRILSVEVEDSGIGISPGPLSNIFESFAQADDSTTRSYGGTGLGLAIVRDLVGLMDGEVSVSSEKGVGSRFMVNLPMQVAPDANSSIELEGKRVLIVDDDPGVGKMLATSLGRLGMKVAVETEGERAVERLSGEAQSARFDLVMVDWFSNTGIDGIETWNRIRSLGLKHLPAAIMMTGYGRDSVERAARDTEIATTLLKPLRRADILQAIKDALARRMRNPAGDWTQASKERLPDLTGLKVLITDDRAINLQVAGELLADVGVDTRTAGSGLAALDLLESWVPDLILMDIQMPGMDGYETAASIRARSEWKDIPILAATAHASLEDRTRSEEAGFQDHLSKPMRPEELYRAIGAATGRVPPETESPVRASEVDNQVSSLLIPGVDTDGAIRRMGGRRSLYFRMLSKFIESEEASRPEVILEALQEGRLDEVKLRVHSLLGTSRTFGCDSIAASAAFLEERLRRTSSLGAVSEMAAAEDLVQLVRTRIPEIERAMEEQRLVPTGQAGPADEVEALLTLLEAFDPEAPHFLKAHREGIGAAVADALPELERLVAEWDFPAARKLLLGE